MHLYENVQNLAGIFFNNITSWLPNRCNFAPLYFSSQYLLCNAKFAHLGQIQEKENQNNSFRWTKLQKYELWLSEIGGNFTHFELNFFCRIVKTAFYGSKKKTLWKTKTLEKTYVFVKIFKHWTKTLRTLS